MVGPPGLEPWADGNTCKADLRSVNLGPQLVSAENYRFFRLRAFATWEIAVAM